MTLKKQWSLSIAAQTTRAPIFLSLKGESEAILKFTLHPHLSLLPPFSQPHPSKSPPPTHWSGSSLGYHLTLGHLVPTSLGTSSPTRPIQAIQVGRRRSNGREQRLHSSSCPIPLVRWTTWIPRWFATGMRGLGPAPAWSLVGPVALILFFCCSNKSASLQVLWVVGQYELMVSAFDLRYLFN